jgi:enoyl-CoA hydratase
MVELISLLNLLLVVYQQIRKGKTLDFKDCFSMELKIAQHMMTQSDFFEGVRALLIDKDKNPKVCAFILPNKQWNPSTLESVKQEDIDLYFK